MIIEQSQGGGAAFRGHRLRPELRARARHPPARSRPGTPNLSPAGFAANAKANAEAADKVSPTASAYVLLILYTIAQTDPSFWSSPDYVDDKAAATAELAKTMPA